MRRPRGMTLIELMAAMFLLSGLMLVMSRTLVLAFAWGRTADEVLQSRLRANRLSQALTRALRQGAPIEALSIAPDGRLREQVLEGALASWSDDALILSREGAYTVITRRDDKVVRRELSWDGRVTVTPLVHGVRELSLDLVRAPSGDLAGIDYTLTFSRGGAPIHGFVGLRTDPLERVEPPAAPAPAPRFARGGPR